MRPLSVPDLTPYFQTVDDATPQDGPFLWTRLFDAQQPVEIDVGCGRGLFLFTAASQHPERNYLGIELDYKEARRGARRLQKIEAANARVLGGDVFRAFSELLPASSVDAIRVYFPDPWWKRRHRERRVFTDRFVDLCANLLKPGGMLHAWTDVEEYFEVIRALMDNHSRFGTLAPPDERAPEHDMDYQTSFERKKRKLGLPIYRGRWQRTDDHA